ncbi:PAX-interacting protein 1-like [Tropilaelaps mercedesae]|uniref:PAX-interacting protein 1 n=1 Tax=Tropilaelaps mercedesae TaxID=418985 RepID=A0A1V9X316_9ACAR|nr:PAX-interacting protein 1-like [Tropilaelaps mercedesae]
MGSVNSPGHMSGPHQQHLHSRLSPSAGAGGGLAGGQGRPSGTRSPSRAGVGVLTLHRGDATTPPSNAHGSTAVGSGGAGSCSNHLGGLHHAGSGSPVAHQGGHHSGPHGGSPHPHHPAGQRHAGVGCAPVSVAANQAMSPRGMPMSPSVASPVGTPALCSAAAGQMLRSSSPQPHHAHQMPQHPHHPPRPHVHPHQQQTQAQTGQLPSNPVVSLHSKMATQMGPNGQRMMLGPHMQRMPMAPGGPPMGRMQIGSTGTQGPIGAMGGPHMSNQQRYVGPMGQQMMGPQGQAPPGVKVNPQTKTALANLLNNRLGGGGQQGEISTMGPQNGPQGGMAMQAQPPTGSTQANMRCYQPAGPGEGQQMQGSQPHTGAPMTYRPVGVPLVRAVRPESGIRTPPVVGAHGQHPHAHVVAQEALVGHEPSTHLSADTCFLGCVFYFLFSHSTEFSAQQISVAKGVCEERGGMVADEYGPEVTHVVCSHQNQPGVERALRDNKRCITVYWINDCVLQGSMVPPYQALHLPAAFAPREQPCLQHIIASTGFSGEERLRIRTMVNKVGAKYSACMTRENSLLIVKSRRWAESGEKLKKAHEWNMTCVSAQWLSDVMLGHYEAVRMPMSSKYQVSEMEIPFLRIDFGIAQPLLMAWKVPIRVTEEQWKNFSSSDLYQRVQKRKLELAEEEAVRKKKPANDENCVTVTNPSPPPEGQRPLVLFSGLSDPEPLKKMVLQLGGQIAKNSREATHLVLARFSRTVKVMCAVNHVKHICCPEWVHESHKANTFLDPTKYWLQDSDAEKQFGFNLRYIHLQRQRNAPPPLKGYTFYVTPGCLPTISVLKELVEAAGGSMFLNKRPTLKYINQFSHNNNNANTTNSVSTHNNNNNNSKDHNESTTPTITSPSSTGPTTANSIGTPAAAVNGGSPPATEGSSKFVCVTCEDDLYMCKELIDNGVRLYNVEVILTSILRQKVELDEYLLDCCI